MASSLPRKFPESYENCLLIFIWLAQPQSWAGQKKHNCASAGDWSLDNRRSLEIMKNLAVLFIMLAVFKKYFC